LFPTLSQILYFSIEPAQMMRVILTMSIFCCYSLQCWSQEETGFYLTTPCAKHSEKYTEVTGKNRTVCLVTEPIIAIDGISSIGEIVVVGSDVTFEVLLTEETFKKLKLISSSLRKTSLGLVLDKKLFVLVSVNEIRSTTTYIFYGKTSSYALIKYYYDILKSEFDAVSKGKTN
jgi:hypothetical protein